MEIQEKIKDAQKQLAEGDVEGWLLYDFRRTNDLACHFLEIPPETMLTRRFFYWIPKKGVPVKIVSAIESATLEHLPGECLLYQTWSELEERLKTLLEGSRKILMEYSPGNAVPYVSKVDAGTMEVVRRFGGDVQSSADLLQRYTSVWDEEKLSLHLQAAEVVDKTVDKAWEMIADYLNRDETITEYAVQQFILEEFRKAGCVNEGDPICAVNAHAADPHYSPAKEACSAIKAGDFILIDLWCKKDRPHGTYADITRVGVAASEPTKRQREIFTIVKEARDTAVRLVSERMETGKPLMGWEVDQASREVIAAAGYGKFFIHRTGHNIDESDHGSGAHMDNYETRDTRRILPRTCFSIEPGIYLPGEFGVRLEYNVYVHHDGRVQLTGGVQDSIRCLL